MRKYGRVDLVKVKAVALIKRFTWLDWVLVVVILAFLTYLIVMGVGKMFRRPLPVEYLAAVNEEIWVDISGAVTTPGVYKLPGGSRVKDVLVLAGGFSSEADREYIAREVNLAALVSDGQKIFVPEKSDPVESGAMGGRVMGESGTRINVNTASLSQLDSLWGVGSARAAEIVKNRPYLKIDDLVTKKVVTKAILEKIRDQISVY